MDVLRRTKGRLLSAAALTVALPLATAAGDLDERRLTFGGFGTIGALYHDEDDLEYRRSVHQARGAEAGELDVETDSLAGLQLNAAWSQRLEAVIQEITRLSPEGDWTPRLTRAFVRYTPDETLALRIGRFGWEIYPRADSRDIGYSQLSIRPAAEVFGFLAADEIDGAEGSLTWPIGAALFNLKLYGGRADGKVVRANGSVNNLGGSKAWGAHVDYIRGPWVVRIGSGVFEADEAPDLDALAAGLRQTGEPQALALADRFDSQERKTLFLVGGAAYDEGPLQARLFVGRTESDSTVGLKINTGLITAGYDIGDVTPYGMLSFIDSHEGIRGTGLPDEAPYASLNAGAYSVQALTYNNQSSLAFGLRYDFMPKLALKLQVDRVWMDGTTLVFEGDAPQRDDAAMTLFGVAVDFVF